MGDGVEEICSFRWYEILLNIKKRGKVPDSVNGGRCVAAARVGFWLLMWDLINQMLFLQLFQGPLCPGLAVKCWLLRSECCSPAVSLESGGHRATPGGRVSCPCASPSCDPAQSGLLPAKAAGGQVGDLLSGWLFAGTTWIRQYPCCRGQWHCQDKLLSPA